MAALEFVELSVAVRICLATPKLNPPPEMVGDFVEDYFFSSSSILSVNSFLFLKILRETSS